MKITKNHVIMLGVVSLALLPAMAWAQGGLPWDDKLDKVVAFLTGGTTRKIAFIAVIIGGILALAGKISAAWAIYFLLGMSLIFGYAAVVSYFGG